MRTGLTVAALVAVLLAPTSNARVPDILSYQGHVSVNGASFSGLGQFKFVLLKGSTVMWRNSADANGDDEPDQAVTLAVTNGLFNVGLGNSILPNMALLTSATIPFNDPGSAPVALRIWFSDGITGFTRLTPDQPLLSTAYAQEAKTVSPGSIGSNQIANASITGNKLAPGLLSKLDAADGFPANVLRVETNGQVIVAGSGSEEAFQGGSLLTLKGSASGPQTFTALSGGLIDDLGGVTTLAGAASVAISGNTAFVVAGLDDAVTAINITDPAAMVVLGAIRQGGAVTSLDNPRHIVVSGNFAFVASSFSDTMTILSVANPTAMTVSSVVKDGVGSVTDLDAAFKIAVGGNFAYVAAANDDAVSIFNVANKSSPTLTFVIKEGVLGLSSSFDTLSDIQLVGNRLYVMAEVRMWIFDVTNPANPSLLYPAAGQLSSVRGWTVEVSGNTAYIADAFGEIQVYDVTTASSPVLRSSVQLLDKGFVSSYSVPDVSPSDLALDGTILYAVFPNQSALYALDVTDPLNLRVSNFSSAHGSPRVHSVQTSLLGANGLATSGGRVFVASAVANTFIALQPSSSASVTPVSLVMDGSLGVGTRNPAAQLHVIGGSAILDTRTFTFGKNSVSGSSSAALGEDCLVTASSSIALGTGLQVRHSSSIVVGFNNFVTNALFAVGNGSASARQNALTILANGNIGLEAVHAPAHPIHHGSGAHLTAGGAWTSASDVKLKENLTPVDSRAVLDRISQLPVYEWNYKVEGDQVRHMGPTAQDFRAAFNLGSDDKSIASIDEAGVALAAIKALVDENRRLRERIDALEKQSSSRTPDPSTPDLRASD